MLRRPDVDEVKAYGEALGLDLTSTEARIMHSRMMATIDALDAFNELRLEEHRPPLRFTDRDPGYRPTEHEDPLNVFIRKCRVAGADHGPLRGKTIGLKDHISVAGVPLTFGSHLMDGYVPDFDATIVTRILDAGGTIVGKLKMEEFSWGGPGLSGVGDYGRPLNPHKRDHVTGGSSFGSAAAVAGGEVDVAFGCDHGGPIRIPSAWTGVVGLTPTHGLERNGARAESVSVPLHARAPLALLPIYLEGGKRMYDTNFGGTFARTYYPSSFISIFGRLKQSHGREFSPNLKLNLMQGHYLQQHYGGRLYAKAQNVRPTFVAQYDRVLAGVDLLAMPTVPLRAPRWREPMNHEEAIEHTLFGGKLGMDLGPVIANTCPFNYTGHPAISIPCGKSEGMPIGLALVAPHFREDVLFRAAHTYQQSVDWAALISTPARGGSKA